MQHITGRYSNGSPGYARHVHVGESALSRPSILFPGPACLAASNVRGTNKRKLIRYSTAHFRLGPRLDITDTVMLCARVLCVLSFAVLYYSIGTSRSRELGPLVTALSFAAAHLISKFYCLFPLLGRGRVPVPLDLLHTMRYGANPASLHREWYTPMAIVICERGRFQHRFIHSGGVL